MTWPYQIGKASWPVSLVTSMRYSAQMFLQLWVLGIELTITLQALSGLSYISQHPSIVNCFPWSSRELRTLVRVDNS